MKSRRYSGAVFHCDIHGDHECSNDMWVLEAPVGNNGEYIYGCGACFFTKAIKLFECEIHEVVGKEDDAKQ